MPILKKTKKKTLDNLEWFSVDKNEEIFFAMELKDKQQRHLTFVRS